MFYTSNDTNVMFFVGVMHTSEQTLPTLETVSATDGESTWHVGLMERLVFLIFDFN